MIALDQHASGRHFLQIPGPTNVPDRVLRRDPRYQAEFFAWAHADAARDGVPVTARAPAVESHDLLPQRPYSERRRAAGRDFEPEPLLAVLGNLLPLEVTGRAVKEAA